MDTDLRIAEFLSRVQRRQREISRKLEQNVSGIDNSEAKQHKTSSMKSSPVQGTIECAEDINGRNFGEASGWEEMKRRRADKLKDVSSPGTVESNSPEARANTDKPLPLKTMGVAAGDTDTEAAELLERNEYLENKMDTLMKVIDRRKQDDRDGLPLCYNYYKVAGNQETLRLTCAKEVDGSLVVPHWIQNIDRTKLLGAVTYGSKLSIVPNSLGKEQAQGDLQLIMSIPCPVTSIFKDAATSTDDGEISAVVNDAVSAATGQEADVVPQMSQETNNTNPAHPCEERASTDTFPKQMDADKARANRTVTFGEVSRLVDTDPTEPEETKEQLLSLLKDVRLHLKDLVAKKVKFLCTTGYGSPNGGLMGVSVRPSGSPTNPSQTNPSATVTGGQSANEFSPTGVLLKAVTDSLLRITEVVEEALSTQDIKPTLRHSSPSSHPSPGTKEHSDNIRAELSVILLKTALVAVVKEYCRDLVRGLAVKVKGKDITDTKFGGLFSEVANPNCAQRLVSVYNLVDMRVASGKTYCNAVNVQVAFIVNRKDITWCEACLTNVLLGGCPDPLSSPYHFTDSEAAKQSTLLDKLLRQVNASEQDRQMILRLFRLGFTANLEEHEGERFGADTGNIQGGAPRSPLNAKAMSSLVDESFKRSPVNRSGVEEKLVLELDTLLIRGAGEYTAYVLGFLEHHVEFYSQMVDVMEMIKARYKMWDEVKERHQGWKRKIQEGRQRGRKEEERQQTQPTHSMRALLSPEELGEMRKLITDVALFDKKLLQTILRLRASRSDFVSRNHISVCAASLDTTGPGVPVGGAGASEEKGTDSRFASYSGVVFQGVDIGVSCAKNAYRCLMSAKEYGMFDEDNL